MSNQILNKAEQRQLTALLEEFCLQFVTRKKLQTHDRYRGCGPVKVRPHRLPPRWEEEINTQLDEILAQNICLPSCSPWASNVVLVAKKDEPSGLLLITDAYSIPNIQSILDKLHGSQYFSAIDISSAYWCVPVAETDIGKTAFNTPRRLHEMLVMPFGLVNSQATFCSQLLCFGNVI